MTIQPTSKTPPEQVHGLSHHPVIRAVLAKGTDYRWTSKEIAEVTGLALRTVQDAAENGLIAHTAYNAQHYRRGANRKARRFTTHDIILWVLESQEGTLTVEATLNILAALLPQLSDAILSQVETVCQTIRRRRAPRLIIATGDPAPAKASGRVVTDDGDQLSLFP